MFVPESPPPPEWPEKLAEKLQGVKKSTAVVIACDSCAIDRSTDHSPRQTISSRETFSVAGSSSCIRDHVEGRLCCTNVGMFQRSVSFVPSGSDRSFLPLQSG